MQELAEDFQDPEVPAEVNKFAPHTSTLEDSDRQPARLPSQQRTH